LYRELVSRGANQIDVADALDELEPIEARLSADDFPALREIALRVRIPSLADAPVAVVAMDWNVGTGTATVVATADGTASVYFSRGGGLIGGGERSTAIRTAALHAIQLANELLPLFRETTSIDLPSGDNVSFYANTSDGVRVAFASEAELKGGTHSLCALGAAMQRIVKEYRSI
jgi:hypothetical protein